MVASLSLLRSGQSLGPNRRDATRPLRGGRVEGKDGDTAMGPRGTPHEICLAACPAELLVSDRLRACLARQVHLQGGIDGDHVVIACHIGRVVGVINGKHLHHGVIVDEVVQLLGTHEKGRHHLVGMKILSGAVDDPFLHQVNNTVGKHFRVDPQIFLAFQKAQDLF